MSDRFQLEGSFTREHVADVRRFAERLLDWVPDSDIRSRMTVATHELFENAIKFSVDGVTALQIEVRRSPQLYVRIVTRNRANDSDLSALHNLHSSLRDATDPMSLYVSLMKAAPNARGGLGIGRVAAESEMKLSMTFEDNLVIISAALEGDA